ncbi:MAG: pilus assembly protein PilP [Azonexus sp.]|uniref:pilus assembly protein PilP n=1 Tax=Azonexus sp. TaxID=1872668 RepID=UPI00281AC012|nr:pilus assembly protein PilP [Azonexus sp.]MDR0775798.1 pilus assembly protein PilP [Azonexus sp.]
MKRIVLVALCGLLGACSGGDQGELRQWMADNSANLRGNIPPLPQVKPYEPVPYDVEGSLDPFNSAKIEPEARNKQLPGQTGPDFEARELRNSLLEKYPIESLKMIGYMNVNNRPLAVIQVDNKVKQIRVGDYIGLDFGMVTRITDKGVELSEMIQDSAGDWSERTSSLYLQSKEGSNK